jgi:hypothetical protein
MAPQMVDEVSVSVAMDWEKLTVWFQHISCSHRIYGQRAGQTRRCSHGREGQACEYPCALEGCPLLAQSGLLLLRRTCPLMTLSRHGLVRRKCLLLGEERTSTFLVSSDKKLGFEAGAIS